MVQMAFGKICYMRVIGNQLGRIYGTVVEDSTSGLMPEGTDNLHVKFCFRKHVSKAMTLLRMGVQMAGKHCYQLGGMPWLGRISSGVFSALPAQNQLVQTNLIAHLLLIKCQRL